MYGYFTCMYTWATVVGLVPAEARKRTLDTLGTGIKYGSSQSRAGNQTWIVKFSVSQFVGLDPCGVLTNPVAGITKGHHACQICILWLATVAKLQLWPSNESNFIVEGNQSMRNGIKGLQYLKVENLCSRECKIILTIESPLQSHVSHNLGTRN